jgi:hypothetical protein
MIKMTEKALLIDRGLHSKKKQQQQNKQNKTKQNKNKAGC